jgi:hypothetical protein
VTATLDQIDAALYTALGGLVNATPSATQPFRHLRRFAGEVTMDLVQHVEQGLYALTPEQHPAALLAFEGVEPLGDGGIFRQDGPRLIQIVARTFWRVFVVVRDLRGDEEALKGVVAGQPGALLCAQRVTEALAGLQISGLFEGGGVRWLGARPWLVARRTAYVYAVRFAADTELPDPAADALPGTPFVFDGAVKDPVETTVTTSTAREPRT